MSSNLNWEDLDSHPIKDLRREAAKLNISTPPRASKKQIIQLLQDHQRDSNTFISNKLLGSSSNNSKEPSQNNSSRQSPKPRESYQSFTPNKNISPHPVTNDYSTQNTISLDNSFQQVQPQEERREKSPLLPSSSSKHRPHSTHKKTPHAEDERKVRYNDADRHSHTKSKVSYQEDYTIPKNLIIMSYISGGCAIFFAFVGIISTPFVLVAILNALLFLYLHLKVNSLLERKSHSLAPKVTSYLENNCGGRAFRRDIKERFRVDTPVMRRLTSFLKSKGRIKIRDHENGEQEWVIVSN